MKALVTGGAGFVGAALCSRLLAEDWSVDVVDDLSSGSLQRLSDARRDHPGRLSFHRLDAASSDLVDLVVRRRPEVVYHLAASPVVAGGVDDPVEVVSTRVATTLRVLEAARHCEARLVHVASAVALLGGPDPHPVPYGTVVPAATPAGLAERAAVDAVALYRRTHGLPAAVAAVANVYGAGQDPRAGAGVVAVWLDRLRRGLTGAVYGDGGHTRDFLFIDDAADALARASQLTGEEPVGIGTGVATTVEQLWSAVSQAAGEVAAPVRLPARPGDVRHCVVDPEIAAQRLGWRAWTTLAEGLARTVDPDADPASPPRR